MAEVGLVRFAQVAREVAETVLPTYRGTYSRHLFTQPSLLAILFLMRYEDWTFRELEVRLGEHQELPTALGVERVPDDTTLSRFLRRLDGAVVTQALTAAVARLRHQGAWSSRSTRRGWPALPPVATSSISRAIGALSGPGSTGRRGWSLSMCCVASCWASSRTPDPRLPRRRYVRLSIWPGRWGRFGSS
jgi:hypothetical protein